MKKTKTEILSEVSKEGIGTLGVMLKEEPNEFRFSITEVYKAMDLWGEEAKSE